MLDINKELSWGGGQKANESPTSQFTKPRSHKSISWLVQFGDSAGDWLTDLKQVILFANIPTGQTPADQIQRRVSASHHSTCCDTMPATFQVLPENFVVVVVVIVLIVVAFSVSVRTTFLSARRKRRRKKVQILTDRPTGHYSNVPDSRWRNSRRNYQAIALFDIPCGALTSQVTGYNRDIGWSIRRATLVLAS